MRFPRSDDAQLYRHARTALGPIGITEFNQIALGYGQISLEIFATDLSEVCF
jgi:hypothetical protein